MIVFSLLCILVTVSGQRGGGPPSGGPPAGGGTGGPPSGGPTTTPTEFEFIGTPCEEEYNSHNLCTSWIRSSGVRSSLFSSYTDDSIGALVDVENVTVDDGGEYFYVYASGIPSYEIAFTSEIIAELNSRPGASSDFRSGTTSISQGSLVTFGADIGYVSTGCETGYWPPGPRCPEDVGNQFKFPVNPTPATGDEICTPGLGSMGVWINGYNVFNFEDGTSYNNEGVWHNVAGYHEAYDMDVCQGHAANGHYHSHIYPSCIQNSYDTDSSTHSPIVGFMADGYPLYGVYQSDNTKAKSCWVSRDYDSVDDPYGCGGTGERSCIMVDQFDKSKGTTAASSNGPRTADSVESMSGNSFTVTSKYYFQDWYYDEECTGKGEEYLDSSNGHSHGKYGYHYHATDTFPFYAGPKLKGIVPDGSFLTTCTYSDSDNGESNSDLEETVVTVGIAVGVVCSVAALAILATHQLRK